MKRVPAAFVIVLTLIGLGGCAARINRTMATWQGANVNNLIAGWGPPTQVLDDGAGGRVFVYAGARSYTTPGTATTQTTGSATGTATTIGNTTSAGVYGTATSHTTYNPSMTYQWQVYRIFWVNQAGVIYRWAWRGI